MKKLLLIFLLVSFELNAQNVRLFQYSTDASGTCQVWNLAQNTTTGALFYCKSIPPTTAWASIPVGSSNVNIGSTGLITNGLIYADTTTSIVSTQVLNSGQILIGRTGNYPAIANLTAGSGVAISNGSGSITISTSGIPSSSLNITTTSCTINQAITAISTSGLGTCTSLNKSRILWNQVPTLSSTGSAVSATINNNAIAIQFPNSSDSSIVVPQFVIPSDATSNQTITLIFGYNADSSPGVTNNKFTFKIKCTRNGSAGSYTSTDIITASNDTSPHTFTGTNTICTTVSANDLLSVEVYRVTGGANDAAVAIDVTPIGFSYTSAQ